MTAAAGRAAIAIAVALATMSTRGANVDIGVVALMQAVSLVSVAGAEDAIRQVAAAMTWQAPAAAAAAV